MVTKKESLEANPAGGKVIEIDAIKYELKLK